MPSKICTLNAIGVSLISESEILGACKKKFFARSDMEQIIDRLLAIG